MNTSTYVQYIQCILNTYLYKIYFLLSGIAVSPTAEGASKEKGEAHHLGILVISNTIIYLR